MTYDHDLFCKAFQQLVLRVRQETLITQKQLSLQSGLTRQFISMLESGHRCPSFENFCSLARGMGLSPAMMSEKFDSIYIAESQKLDRLAAEPSNPSEYIKKTGRGRRGRPKRFR
ncbi:MAG: helix-turn-helix transcriptional regulator [Fibrobacter sp.]|uniref:helix-turn-helix domain-containing protein n=1 Tax=Fibrobacter sp. UWP2 TaxID=1896216 RepID=UPI0011603EEA|nr:helix-turn-helix transcriptional regulator [Fibrobacter sp.]